MKKGEITVFLSLILLVMISFITAVIEAARVNTIRFQIECAMDMGMYSALAEYHRELLGQYDLFYIDTSYGKNASGPDITAGHIAQYMSYNLCPDQDITGFMGRDLLALEMENVNMTAVSNAADDDCAGLKSQAVSYMKDKVGIKFIDGLLQDIHVVEDRDMTEGIEQERKSNKEKVDSYDGKKVQVSGDEWKEVKVDNPVEDIPIRDSGFLYRVTSGSGGVSGRRITQDNYISKRKLNQGDGLAPGRKPADSIQDEILFGEYLLEHCGSYTNPLEKSLLTYQMEYILAGKDSDSANLEAVLYRILMIREVANYLYLLTDSVKMGEAEGLAAGVSAIALVPELEPVLKQAILLGWAYAEGVNDIKILMEQGKVPLFKDSGSWQLGISQMLHYTGHLSKGGEDMEGLSYTDYLRILLLLQNPADKVRLFGDIVEMDIRRTRGNERFRLDCCIDSMEAEAVIASGYGCRYHISRRYGYENME